MQILLVLNINQLHTKKYKLTCKQLVEQDMSQLIFTQYSFAVYFPNLTM